MARLVQLLHFSDALHVRVETGSAWRQRASDTPAFLERTRPGQSCVRRSRVRHWHTAYPTPHTPAFEMHSCSQPFELR